MSCFPQVFNTSTAIIGRLLFRGGYLRELGDCVQLAATACDRAGGCIGVLLLVFSRCYVGCVFKRVN